MTDLLTFILISFIASGIYISYQMKKSNLGLSYFKTKEGKKIRFGILAALFGIPLIGLLLFFLPNNANAQNDMLEGKWFNDAGVVLGIDYTKDVSPQCEPNSVDEHGTSYLAAFVNVWQNNSKTVRVDWNVWNHHSCIIGPDRNVYDSTGIHLRWTPWKIK